MAEKTHSKMFAKIKYYYEEGFWRRIVKLSATPLRNRPHMVFCSQGTS